MRAASRQRASTEEYERAKALFRDWRWRLNNLYWITNKDGKRVKFKMNWAQERLWNEMHYFNLILKARQLGMTTFIQLFFLDACIFNSNIRAGVIAHNKDDAQVFFRDKIKHAYESMPEAIRALRPLTTDSKTELLFNNNSSIRVGTSLRSGTLQYLHISEYGKLCAKFPEKAREVRSGALNTIQAGQVVFIESTAEGQEGHFFDLCQEAEAAANRGDGLSKLDWKFHFFPWWQAPEYRIEPRGVLIPIEMQRYFDKLELEHGVILDRPQKAWYTKKSQEQQEDMKREFPSTSAEAFEASVEGAYYGSHMAKAEMEGRVGKFEAVPYLPVLTSWDIGRSDYTSIWFWQRTGGKIRIVGFFQDCGEGLPYYAGKVREVYAKHGWNRDGAVDYVPHDAKVIEWGSERSRIEQMISHGFKPKLPTELSIHDGINAVRAILPLCLFDQENCSEGIKALKSYRKDWDEDLGMFRDVPRHDIHSHAADSMRYLACAFRDLEPTPPPPSHTFVDPRGNVVPAHDLVDTHEFETILRDGDILLNMDDIADLEVEPRPKSNGLYERIR